MKYLEKNLSNKILYIIKLLNVICPPSNRRLHRFFNNRILKFKTRLRINFISLFCFFAPKIENNSIRRNFKIKKNSKLTICWGDKRTRMMAKERKKKMENKASRRIEK